MTVYEDEERCEDCGWRVPPEVKPVSLREAGEGLAVLGRAGSEAFAKAMTSATGFERELAGAVDESEGD